MEGEPSFSYSSDMDCDRAAADRTKAISETAAVIIGKGDAMASSFVVNRFGASVNRIDERLGHIMATGMINAFFEMVLHKMPFEDAKLFLQQLNDYLMQFYFLQSLASFFFRGYCVNIITGTTVKQW